MKKTVAILLTLCSLISLCSCDKAVDADVREKYKKLTDHLENENLYDAYNEFWYLTKDFKKDIQAPTSKESNEYINNVTEVKITKDNLLDYFEIVNQDKLMYNLFNEVTDVNINTVLQLKSGLYLADNSNFRTEIHASFTATLVQKFYTLDAESGLLILGDYVPDLDDIKKNETLQAVVYSESTYLGTPYGKAHYGTGKAINLYINIKPTEASGTLYLANIPKYNSETKDKYKALIDALNERDIYKAKEEFTLLTENARKKQAKKEYEEYKKKVTEIEINNSNLLDYFEFVNLNEFQYNAFGEVESISIKTVLRLKDGFTLADTTKFMTRIYADVGITETTRIFHFDQKSNNFTLKGYAPKSDMYVQLRDTEITITENDTEVLTPYYAKLDPDRPYIQLGENGRIFNASGKLYLLNK